MEQLITCVNKLIRREQLWMMNSAYVLDKQSRNTNVWKPGLRAKEK